MRSSGDVAGSKRQQQSLPSTSQQNAHGVPSVQAVFTEEAFLVENYREWGLSDDALRRIKDLMVGEPVEPADFTESELKAAGYFSWKQFEVCAALRAW